MMARCGPHSPHRLKSPGVLVGVWFICSAWPVVETGCDQYLPVPESYDPLAVVRSVVRSFDTVVIPQHPQSIFPISLKIEKHERPRKGKVVTGRTAGDFVRWNGLQLGGMGAHKVKTRTAWWWTGGGML